MHPINITNDLSGLYRAALWAIAAMRANKITITPKIIQTLIH